MELNTIDLAIERREQESRVTEPDVVDLVIEKYKQEPWALISILQYIQDKFG